MTAIVLRSDATPGGGPAPGLLLATLGALGLAACAGPGESGRASRQVPGPLDPTPEVYERRITARESYAEIAAMPRAFRRPTDPYVGPAFVLFAENGRLACLVGSADFVMAVEGTMWPCRWRHPR